MQTTDAEVSQAITGCIAIGPGSIINFSVNGKVLLKKVVWKNYCVLDAFYGGLICDNQLKAALKPGDTWSAEIMNCATAINRVDPNLMTSDVEDVKKRVAKKGKVVNIN